MCTTPSGQGLVDQQRAVRMLLEQGANAKSGVLVSEPSGTPMHIPFILIQVRSNSAGVAAVKKAKENAMVEVDDDCQRMVKAALGDSLLQSAVPLTSANSISLGRLLPQMSYYAHAALGWWREHGEPLNVIIPTGNLGNAMACLWVREMGLPIGEIQLACNANATLPDYLGGADYQARAAISTLANAMDVGAPSNVERLRWTLPDEHEMRAQLQAHSVRLIDPNRSAVCATTSDSLTVCEGHDPSPSMTAQHTSTVSAAAAAATAAATAGPPRNPNTLPPIPELLGLGSSATALQQLAAVSKAFTSSAFPILQHGNVACAAASSSNDPYSVLGIKPDATSNEINRAYTKKKYEARLSVKDTAKVEQAHSSIMMSGLTARMKAGASKDVAYADTEPLFPWRPKSAWHSRLLDLASEVSPAWRAMKLSLAHSPSELSELNPCSQSCAGAGMPPPKIIMIIGGLQLAMTAFGFQSPQMSKVIACMLIGMVGNVMKQNSISPPPRDASMATDEEAGRAGANVTRGALLGVMGTFAGICIASIPEVATKYLPIPPLGELTNFLVPMKIACVALSNWLITAFYY
ncbi:MAG: hypothetical protein WDW38_001811 [Sanguina aurantia]